MAKVANISEAAKILLLSTGTNRQGAKLLAPAAPVVVKLELREAGYIGQDGGLTRKGSIARERIENAMCAELGL